EAVGKARNLGGDSNAEVAAALIRRGDDTWAQTEDKLRDVLKASADNIPAHIALAQLLQSVGRTRESMQENAIIRKLDERAAEGWPAQDFRWAIQLWIVGERDQASQAALRVTRDHDLLHPAAWRNALFVHAMTADYRKAETLLERARREA